MDRHSSNPNVYGHDPRMLFYNSADGLPASAALLLGPKRMKKQAANGIPTTSYFESFKTKARCNSEPSELEAHLHNSDVYDPHSKDDAHSYIEGRGKRLRNLDAAQLNSATVRAPAFSARQLLDPKDFKQDPKATSTDTPSSKLNGISSAGSMDQAQPVQQSLSYENPIESQGLGGMIERIHGISHREERPKKRQKKDDEDADDTKMTFTGGTKGGEISEFLRQKRKEGQDKADVALSASVVDLTGGDDEDIVLISDSQEKEVCYGRIEGTKVSAHRIPDPDRIDLPGRTDQIVRLRFSTDEEKLYEWFARDSDRRMSIIASEQRKSLGGKSYVHILRAIMRLRLICAHGRELLSEDDLKLTEGFSVNNAIDLESDESEGNKLFTNARQAYEMLMLFRETDADTCCQCAKKIGPDLEVAGPDQDQIIGHMLPCYQVVCEECFPGFRQSLDMSSTNFTCPYCDQAMRTSFFELTQHGIKAAEDARERAKEDPKHAKIMGRYGGPHTKTRALLAALEESKIESQDLPAGQSPIKSVVFSGWTTHLDLIQIALEEHRVRYVRLDGKMGRKQRAASLEAFRDDPNVTLILISIGAGGLGLNLTTGSKVYMMEPQFNPAAEAQAVDRIHRLGQTRAVTITRYIMEGSFEEKMLALQKKKQSLADLSMNRGKLDKAEAARQRLEELRSLFK
ncbi:MAG: hypothetical protein Q9166_006698 [cf. Caloplaca sp. 2 TL-2023]